ncbi:Gfo/Idh/MocA family protein [Haloarchaeobius sp. TZWSO28]|uniref:Gfo/Idh/MocA family protein n=1 Tax=Haloarchaeobius sp. TZWSO28 TaxID=3446119 RepID=UPI003EBCE7D3
MATYRVACIGTGPDPETPVWGESAAMAYRHAAGYRKLDNCDIVACADLVRENANAFAAEFDIDDEHVYEDYTEMLSSAQPDVVSICTPVPTHATIVVDCAESGVPDAIHCEKPMATTWNDCQRMARVCEDAGVQLTFNHQRRFDERWTEAKRLLDDGVIGDLRRIEMGGKNIFDYGSHLVDLCNYFTDGAAAEWILGGIDYRTEDVRYGAHNENHALAQWVYENGVSALAATGGGEGLVGCHHRLVGTDGEIEVLPEDGPALRVRRGDEWESKQVDGGPALHRAVEHVVTSLDEDVEPDLSSARALESTEIIYAVWESARCRGRVDLPLDIEDNPLEAMVDAGALSPSPADDD